MIKLNSIEIPGFVIHSEEFMKDQDAYICKLQDLLRKYRDHVAFHEGINYLRDSIDESDYLTNEEMKFITKL